MLETDDGALRVAKAAVRLTAPDPTEPVPASDSNVSPDADMNIDNTRPSELDSGFQNSRTVGPDANSSSSASSALTRSLVRLREEAAPVRGAGSVSVLQVTSRRHLGGDLR